MLTIMISTLFGSVEQVNANDDVTTNVAVFSDVSQTHWAYSTISWATAKGYMKGFNDGTFKPENKVTEAEYIAVLSRLVINVSAGKGGSHWAAGAYQAFIDYHIPAKGYESDANKNERMTRGEFAMITMSVLAGRSVLSEKSAIDMFYKLGLTSGNVNIKGDRYAQFAPSGTLTRAELVAFLQRMTAKGLVKAGMLAAEDIVAVVDTDITAVYDKTVKQIKELGFTKNESYGDPSFLNMRDPITREQITLSNWISSLLIKTTGKSAQTIKAAEVLLKGMGLNPPPEFSDFITSPEDQLYGGHLTIDGVEVLVEVKSGRFLIYVFYDE